MKRSFPPRSRAVANPILRANQAELSVQTYELKQVTSGPGGAPLTIAGTVGLINGVQTGSSSYNRVGRRIMMKGLRVHVKFTPSTNVAALYTDSETELRYLIVYDRQPNGSAVAVADVLSQIGQDGTVTTNSPVEHPPNPNNRQRFLVLRDYRLIAPNTVGTTPNIRVGLTPQQPLLINDYVKLKKLITHYKSDSNPCTIADIETGALLSVYCASNGVAGTPVYYWDVQNTLTLSYFDY